MDGDASTAPVFRQLLFKPINEWCLKKKKYTARLVASFEKDTRGVNGNASGSAYGVPPWRPRATLARFLLFHVT